MQMSTLYHPDVDMDRKPKAVKSKVDAAASYAGSRVVTNCAQRVVQIESSSSDYVSFVF